MTIFPGRMQHERLWLLHPHAQGVTATEILISEVLIISILIPTFAKASKNAEATPEWERIPTPTTETFAILVLYPICHQSRLKDAPSMLFLPESVFGWNRKGKVGLTVSSHILNDHIDYDTTSAITLKTAAAAPGRSGSSVILTRT